MESQQSSAARDRSAGAFAAKQRAERQAVESAMVEYEQSSEDDQKRTLRRLFEEEHAAADMISAIHGLTNEHTRLGEENQRLGAKNDALEQSLKQATADSVRHAQRVQRLSVELTECNTAFRNYKQQAESHETDEAGVDFPDDAPATQMSSAEAMHVVAETFPLAEVLEALPLVQGAYAELLDRHESMKREFENYTDLSQPCKIASEGTITMLIQELQKPPHQRKLEDVSKQLKKKYQTLRDDNIKLRNAAVYRQKVREQQMPDTPKQPMQAAAMPAAAMAVGGTVGTQQDRLATLQQAQELDVDRADDDNLRAAVRLLQRECAAASLLQEQYSETVESDVEKRLNALLEHINMGDAEKTKMQQQEAEKTKLQQQAALAEKQKQIDLLNSQLQELKVHAGASDDLKKVKKDLKNANRDLKKAEKARDEAMREAAEIVAASEIEIHRYKEAYTELGKRSMEEKRILSNSLQDLKDKHRIVPVENKEMQTDRLDCKLSQPCGVQTMRSTSTDTAMQTMPWPHTDTETQTEVTPEDTETRWEILADGAVVRLRWQRTWQRTLVRVSVLEEANEEFLVAYNDLQHKLDWAMQREHNIEAENRDLFIQLEEAMQQTCAANERAQVFCKTAIDVTQGSMFTLQESASQQGDIARRAQLEAVDASNRCLHLQACMNALQMQLADMQRAPEGQQDGQQDKQEDDQQAAEDAV